MSNVLYELALTIFGFTPWVSLLILLLLLLRKSRISLSAQFYRAAWWILTLRCAIPFPLRLSRFTPTLTVQLPVLSASHPSAADLHTVAQNSIIAEIAANPGEASAGLQRFGIPILPNHALLSLAEITGVLMVLWLAGTLLVLCLRFGSYGFFMYQLRKTRAAIISPALLAVRDEVFGKPLPLYSCPSFRSPSLAGFFRKAIYLPSDDIPEQQLCLILQHENCHARRHDLALKLLLVFSTAFCWFNPLIWRMAKAADEDIECACDEVMLHGKSLAFCQEYGRVLLNTLKAGQLPHGLSTSFAGDARQLHHRFEAMYSGLPKKQAKPLLALFCASVMASSLFFACTPANQSSSLADALAPASAGAERATGDSSGSNVAAPSADWAVPLPDYKPELLVVKNNGLEFYSAAPEAAVVATAAGTVATVVSGDAVYGNYLIIDHGSGITSFYAFCDTIQVAEGRSVSQGSVLGSVMGAKGKDAMLYFELRQDGSAVDTSAALGLSGIDSSDASDTQALVYPVAASGAKGMSRGFTGADAHAGLDLRGQTGTPIFAAAGGTVSVAETGTTGYGNFVKVDHGNGIATLYAQCDTLTVKEGDTVQAGQQIATLGSSGNSTGPHLHFELLQNDQPIDPEPFLQPAE